MDIQRIIQLAGLLLIKLGPLFFIFYFLLDSILETNIRGIVLVAGLLVNIFLTLIIGNTFFFHNDKIADDGICFPISISNIINISNLPLSQSIYGFIFVYLMIPVIKYNYFLPNLGSFLFILLLISADAFLLREYKCFHPYSILLSLFIGIISGFIYLVIQLLSANKDHLYIMGLEQSTVCQLPEKKRYKCLTKQR